MPVTIKPDNYTVEATATKRELQELEYVLDKYFIETQHTSGDNPAFQFMKDFLAEIDKAVYGREKRKKRKTLSVGNWDDDFGPDDDDS